MGIRSGDIRGDCNFLYWIHDRLVHVYKEHPDTDFILRLEELAQAMPDGRIQNNERFIKERK